MAIRCRSTLVALFLLVLAAGAAAEAQQYCGDVCCYIPPRAYCTEECLTCEPDSGTEYPYPPYCDRPIVITVAQCGCPCYQASTPNVDPNGGFDLNDLLRQLVPVAAEPPSQGAPDAVAAPKADAPRRE
jgi:hypothetical protein